MRARSWASDHSAEASVQPVNAAISSATAASARLKPANGSSATSTRTTTSCETNSVAKPTEPAKKPPPLKPKKTISAPGSSTSAAAAMRRSTGRRACGFAVGCSSSGTAGSPSAGASTVIAAGLYERLRFAPWRHHPRTKRPTG